MDEIGTVSQYHAALMPAYLFKSPCNISIYGSSGSGKSTLLYHMLKERNKIFSNDIEGVLFCHAEPDKNINAKMRHEAGKVTFYTGIPSMPVLKSYLEHFKGQHSLIIFDDLAIDFVKDRGNLDLIIKYGHRYNANVVITFHNPFEQSPISRTLSLSTHYIILMRSLRDRQSIARLGAQIFPGKSKNFMQIYDDITENRDPSSPVPPAMLINIHPLDSTKGMQIFANFLGSDTMKLMYEI